MVEFEKKTEYGVYDLKEIIRLLRGEGGCPWDREQTHESIRRNFIEETYEAVEAINDKDTEHLKEELGDVLMQVMFHAQIEEEQGGFDLDAVADSTCKKLIVRHPHVFGDTAVSDSEEVLANWDQIKRLQNGQKTHTSAMDSVARSLPSLWRAEKIQKKAAKAGFDWEDVSGALKKLTEEVSELEAEIDKKGNCFEELGDVLFAVVNVARFIDADPEEALASACEKFIRRFKYVEDSANQQGKKPEDMSLEELDKLWEECKAQEKAKCD